jgi:hypothetical protein
MAEKLGYMILAEEFTGVNKDKESLELVYAEIQRLSATPSPDNLYQLAELVSYSTTHVLNQRLNWLDTIADVKRGAEGDKPEWTIDYTGIVAEIGAKGSTPQVSQLFEKKVAVPTFQISTRPKINHQDFVQRPHLILKSIEEAALRMENALIKYVQDAMFTTFSVLADPNYNTGAGVSKTILDEQMRAIQYIDQVSIIGDIKMISQLTGLTGFFSRVPDQLMLEHNERRHIGTYNNANVVELTNRYNDEFSLAKTNLVLRNDLLFIVPTGSPERRPLKVFLGGEVRTRPHSSPEDDSYEFFMRMDFAVAVVGNQLATAVYRDTSA